MKTLLTYRKPIVALFAIVFALTLHGVSSTQAYTHIYVDAVSGTNAPTGKGSASSPYQSITYALLISARNNLADPWHVHIHPGSYNGDPAKGNAREIFPLKLRQEMIFEGTTTAAECIIDGQHTGAANVPILLGENTEGVTIRNLTIQNSLRTSGTGGIVLHDPTGTKETPSTFEGCIIHNNKGGGLWSNMPLILTGNTFSNNHGAGVWSSKSTAAMNNTFSANVGNGLYIEGNSTGGISENVFENNSESGVHVKNTLENNVTQNTFSNNAKEGISVEGHIGEGFVGDITHNTFTGNKWGGFDIRGFTGNVAHNTFDSNHGNGGGGGFRIIGNFTGGNVIHNVFIGNIVVGDGGAGFLITGNFTGNVAHNTFDGNQHKGSWHANGGGFCVKGTFTGEITDNRFTRNMIYSFGGAFFVQALTRKISRNIFDGNSAESGGAFELGMSTNTVEVFNNIFFNSTASITGNSVVTKHATHFMNNLFMISDELSEGVSSAHTIWVSSPECRFHNNIFSGVKTAIYTQGTFDLPITHNLFHNVKIDFVEQAGNNLGNDLLFWELVAVNATNNLEGDPQLVDPVTSRDFHLQATSPAINAGTNAFAPADDLDGVTRPVGATVDIGPYEYGGTPVVTTQDPPVGDDDPTWGKRKNLSPETTQEDPVGDQAPILVNAGVGDKPASESTDTPVETPSTDIGIVRAEDLVLYLPFDEGTGNTVEDLSKHNNNGTVRNTRWVQGKYGKAIELTGQRGGGIEVPDSPSLDITDEITLMVWVYPTRFTQEWLRIMVKTWAGDTAPWMVYGLYQQGDSNGKVRFTISVDGGREVRCGNGPSPQLPLNQWTHLAATYDGSRMKLYYNGELKVETAATGRIDTNDVPLSIGRNSEGDREHYIGLIDEVGIWSVALDESEIRQAMKDKVVEDLVSDRVSPAWDVNEDGTTNIADLVLVATSLATSPPKHPRADVNKDGTVNIQDLILVATHLGETTDPAAPDNVALPENLTPETLRPVLNLLQAQNDGSLAFQRAIGYLEHLLVSLIPKETVLLANYPNPFNPETWIPYQLAKSADVTVHIYGINGTLVRTLFLGHQMAGSYHNKSRAAYWDGKNEIGEPVASGIYFYTLTAGNFVATRKMLIRK